MPTETFKQAEAFLKAHYCEDNLSAAQIASDRRHWQTVAANPARFPNADRDWISRFDLAASLYLASGGALKAKAV